MEVHAHAHTERKKWTHYLWEFLMLFLAVFCGFFAEYQLEHKIEKERGREYAISFREDLCKDTAILNTNIIGFQRNIAAADSIVHMIAQRRVQIKEDIKKLYEYNIPALGGFAVILTDRTAAQLKNSGGMRLITRKKVVEGIISYWSNMASCARIEEMLQTMRMQAREKSYLFFDQQYYADSSVNGKRAIADDAALMTKDNLLLTEFANRLSHVKNLMKGTYTTFLKKQKTEADTLMMLIDKEYHLK